jgi:hypothetical protein
MAIATQAPAARQRPTESRERVRELAFRPAAQPVAPHRSGGPNIALPVVSTYRPLLQSFSAVPVGLGNQ